MNQILSNKTTYKCKKKYCFKIKFLKVQFWGSVFFLFVMMSIFLINIQIRNSKEAVSKQIKNNYNILRLYNNNFLSNNVTYTQSGQVFTIIGMIEIPKINIYYPIISEATDDLLKISPCRISGPMPNQDGNLCIAGHNYDNYKFFSKVSSLIINDEIFIYDMYGNKSVYKIFKKYEVFSNDLSPLEDLQEIKKQVTLITCNNFNSSTRIIIKASIV